MKLRSDITVVNFTRLPLSHDNEIIYTFQYSPEDWAARLRSGQRVATWNVVLLPCRLRVGDPGGWQFVVHVHAYHIQVGHAFKLCCLPPH